MPTSLTPALSRREREDLRGLPERGELFGSLSHLGSVINLRGNVTLNEIPTFSYTSLSPARERVTLILTFPHQRGKGKATRQIFEQLLVWLIA